MKRICCFFSAFVITSVVLAQKELPDFGKIDTADLLMKSCYFEPGANALKLFDVQEIAFEPSEYNSKLKTERRARIKVFNQKGYKYASVRIPYFSKKGVTKIKELKGIIYNLDSSGKIITQKLEKKDFFKEKAESNIGIINFTFPNLRPGSVIEFSYTKIEKSIIQIDPWIAQAEIPTAYASTVLITPSFSRVKEKIFGADTIGQKKEQFKEGGYSKNKRTYFRENIVSFQPEPFMSSSKDNLLKMIFLLIPESNFLIDALTSPESIWKFAGASLMQSPHFGGQIKRAIPGTEKIVDSAKAIISTADRISFIYEAVKKRMTGKTEQTLYPNDIIEAWNTNSGNTAEINLLLLNLLKKSDINCFPLLVSTRENGMVDMKFPSIGQLNGVDVLAFDSSQVYFMDASLKFQSSQNPPFNILNRNAFLLQEDNMRWIWVDDKRPLLKQNIIVQCEVKDDGNIEGTASCSYYDYAKSYMLDSTIEDEGEDKFYDKNPDGLNIKTISQKGADNDNEPLVQKIEFTYTPQKTGDFYFINSQLLSLKKENPFIKEGRNTDIDLGCNQELVLKLKISIPPTFQIEDLPKDIIVRAPDSSFLFKRIVSSDSTGIFMSQTFDINQSFFYRDNYPGLREFFQRVFALMAEEITLKRKK